MGDRRGEGAWRCGIDEAGRGCLAGPIYAAAVILDPDRPVSYLADSKTMTEKMRAQIALGIRAKALAHGIGTAGVQEINHRGIEWANRIAFSRAVRDLARRSPNLSLDTLTAYIDGNRRAWRLSIRQVTVTGGDKVVPEISAASILAKTSRDRWVVEIMHTRYPQYGFDRHKGYATRAHAHAVRMWGPTPFHRTGFRIPVWEPRQEGKKHLD